MRKAFTLIELLVVITILAILTGAALPFVQNYVEESRQAKAKSDLDEIARALVVYESREGDYNKRTVEDLTGRYLDRSPIDPWGVPYVVATESGIVYSLGPDRKDSDGDPSTEGFGYDNIEVSYLPPLALVSVRWIDKNKSGAVDTQNVQDEIHLQFSRRLAVVGGKELVDPLNLEDLLKNVLIYRDPDNPTTSEPLSHIVSNPEPKAKIVNASRTIVLPLSETPTAHAVTNVKYFVAGQDSLMVKTNHGLIKDNSRPLQNDCIAGQAVRILSQ